MAGNEDPNFERSMRHHRDRMNHTKDMELVRVGVTLRTSAILHLIGELSNSPIGRDPERSRPIITDLVPQIRVLTIVEARYLAKQLGQQSGIAKLIIAQRDKLEGKIAEWDLVFDANNRPEIGRYEPKK